MKQIALLLFIVITNLTYAQKVKVENAKYKFISGEKHALKVIVFTDDTKDILKAFQKELTKDVGTTITEQKKNLF